MGLKNVEFNLKNITENILGKLVRMKLPTSSGTKNDPSSTLTGQCDYQDEKWLREFQVQKGRTMAYYGRLDGKL